MPSSPSNMAPLVTQRLRRRNRRILLAYAGFVAAIVLLEALGFKFVMWWAEGRDESLGTGLYWTLSTMSTLGLGDIVFESTPGRLYTSLVLVSGILLLLVVLPFAFIQFFYAPWLASHTLPGNLSDHVIIAGHGDLAQPLIDSLELHRIQHVLVEPDPNQAEQLEAAGVPVVARPLDEQATYKALRTGQASVVVLDGSDAENTTSALQIHELYPQARIFAVAHGPHAEEILRLAGVRRVLPLKRQLGEHLAARLNAGHAQTHTIGRFHNLHLAELPVQMTPWAGKTIAELSLREKFGVNVVGVIENAGFTVATSATQLAPQSVPVVIGTADQIRRLDEFLIIYNVNYHPVVVIGGGEVGRAATRSLRRRGVPVHVVDRNPHTTDWGDGEPTKWITGEAEDHAVLERAGIREAPGVVLTTNDDAINIYLALLCSHAANDIRIISRVNHERNMAAVRRAGADVAISHTSLGVSSVFAALRDRDLVVLGEDVEVHEFGVPSSLIGTALSDTAIATRTGLNVIAIKKSDQSVSVPSPSTVLADGDTLLTIGDREQLHRFVHAYT